MSGKHVDFVNDGIGQTCYGIGGACRNSGFEKLVFDGSSSGNSFKNHTHRTLQRVSARKMPHTSTSSEHDLLRSLVTGREGGNHKKVERGG